MIIIYLILLDVFDEKSNNFRSIDKIFKSEVEDIDDIYEEEESGKIILNNIYIIFFIILKSK